MSIIYICVNDKEEKEEKKNETTKKEYVGSESD